MTVKEIRSVKKNLEIKFPSPNGLNGKFYQIFKRRNNTSFIVWSHLYDILSKVRLFIIGMKKRSVVARG